MFSRQFETGSQPTGAESPFSGTFLPKGNPDLPAESWFRYGARAGVCRGTPALVKAIDKFIQYAKEKQGVVFMRKADIVKLIQNDSNPPVDNAEETYNK